MKTLSAYGRRYKEARARLLASNPPCHWCGAPATTADHEPPISVYGGPHLNLVPACQKCNLGRRSSAPKSSKSRDW